MGETQQQEVVIVGGGIAGLATAVALLRVGVKSLVLESHHELRTAGAALTLAPNAWRALDVLGVASKLIPIYQALQKGLVTNIENGSIQEINYNGANFSKKNNNEPKDSGLGLRSVHRKALLQALAEELPPGTVRFSSKVASIKAEVLQNSSSVQILQLEDGTVIEAKGTTKPVYAPEPYDVGRILQAEVISSGERVTVTTNGPIDPAAGLGSNVEALVRKPETTFNVPSNATKDFKCLQRVDDQYEMKYWRCHI